jgi:hypothetical protein
VSSAAAAASCKWGKRRAEEEEEEEEESCNSEELEFLGAPSGIQGSPSWILYAQKGTLQRYFAAQR